MVATLPLRKAERPRLTILRRFITITLQRETEPNNTVGIAAIIKKTRRDLNASLGITLYT